MSRSRSRSRRGEPAPDRGRQPHRRRPPRPSGHPSTTARPVRRPARCRRPWHRPGGHAGPTQRRPLAAAARCHGRAGGDHPNRNAASLDSIADPHASLHAAAPNATPTDCEGSRHRQGLDRWRPVVDASLGQPAALPPPSPLPTAAAACRSRPRCTALRINRTPSPSTTRSRII